MPAGTGTEVASAITELKALLDDPADPAALRAGIEKLASVSRRMGQAMYEQARQAPAHESADGGAPADEEGVVDAEIVDDDRADRPGGRDAEAGGPGAA